MHKNTATIKSGARRRSRRSAPQLALDLRPTPQWGGARCGAGRKPGLLRRDPHRRREPLSSRHPCHVTLRVRRDMPSLRNARFVRDLERSLREIRERGRVRVVHYSVQANHLHLIVEAASGVDLSSGMKSIVARVARAANRVFRRDGAVMDDRFHARVLRTPREARHAIAYVLLNERRHLAKLGRRVDPRGAIDPASSGRWFDGWRRGRAERGDHSSPNDVPAVARARSWLLTVGWRRGGLVDPVEVPGMIG